MILHELRSDLNDDCIYYRSLVWELNQTQGKKSSHTEGRIRISLNN